MLETWSAQAATRTAFVRGKNIDLRITGVRVHTLSAQLKERFGWSLNWASTRTGRLIEVSTDAGVTGWGDGICDTTLLAQRADRILGRSPFEVEAIYHELRETPAAQLPPGPPACPGLDIALWDIVGKALNKPVSALLGPVYRDRIPAYVTALYRKDWPNLAEGLAAEAESWVAAGYRSMKMKIGFSPETDIDIVAAVRRAIGPAIALGVDSNCAYDSGTALRVGAQLEQFNLMWWEEPVLSTDFEGYRRLKNALKIPLAGGETGQLDGLVLNYIQPSLVDILQPDIENIGLTGARFVTQLCWMNRLRLVPHNWGTALRTAATLHWMSTCPPLTPALNPPGILFEFDQTEHPFRDGIIREKIAFNREDGTVTVPTGPGLGVTVLPEAVAEFRTDLFSI
jgi:D-galactarolactone cycloisomerase